MTARAKGLLGEPLHEADLEKGTSLLVDGIRGQRETKSYCVKFMATVESAALASGTCLLIPTGAPLDGKCI